MGVCFVYVVCVVKVGLFLVVGVGVEFYGEEGKGLGVRGCDVFLVFVFCWWWLLVG